MGSALGGEGEGEGGGELVHQSDVRFLWLAFVNP